MPLNASVGFSLDENKAYLAYPLKKGTHLSLKGVRA
jgi:hypothetical protein